MPLVNCLAKPELQGLDSGDVSRIQELVARYEADGQTPARAEQSAVQAILSDVYQERASISSQVVAKGGLPPSRTAVENAATTVRPGGLSSGQTRAITNQFIEPFKQVGIQNVRVINSGQVQGITGQAVPEGKIVKGFLLNDTAYVVHDNLQSQADVETALAHEVVGHLGINNIMSGEQWASLKKEYQAYKSAGNQAFNDLVSEVNRRYNNPGIDTEVKEALALMAEQRNRRGPIEKLYKKAVSLVVEGLRKLGVIRGQFMQAQMDRLLDRSESFLRSEPQAEGVIDQAMEPQFSVSDRKVRRMIQENLTEEERGRITKQGEESLNEFIKKIGGYIDEVGAMAIAGKAKRGWYKNSADAIETIFGEQDMPRFVSLLAALSPQTSVESNLRNALNVWKGWVAANRPLDKDQIMEILEANVEGEREDGGSSVLNAWVNNSIRALTNDNPLALSGPKVDSFAKNLVRIAEEVTNDTWMARAWGVLQSEFGGKTRAEDVDDIGRMGMKGPGYLGANAATRAVSDRLTEITGDNWTPAEVQETVWSFVKSIWDTRKNSSAFDKQKGMLYLFDNNVITDDMIAATPDFGSLFLDPEYRKILEEAGYGSQLEQLAEEVQYQDPGTDVGSVDDYGQRRALRRGVRRLESQYRDEQRPTVIGKARKEFLGGGYSVDPDGGESGAYRRRGGRNAEIDGVKAVWAPKPELKRLLNFSDVSTPDFHEIESSEQFHEKISSAKASTRFGASVHVYPVRDYDDMRLFVTPDGNGGFALNGDDIVSVFSHTQSSHSNFSVSAMMMAIQQGGRRADAFDTVLPHLYAQVGMKVVARVPWNEDEAPSDWDKNTYKAFKKGEPDVVMLAYDPDFTGTYKPTTQGKKVSDWDDGVALQDEFIASNAAQFSMDDVNEIEQEEQASAASKGLPMDRSARLMRAEFMGFDTDQVWYHGTSSDVEGAFIPSTDGNLGPGIYFTPSTEKGSSRAMIARFKSGDTGAGPNVVPVFLRQEKILELDQNPVTKVDTERLKSEGYTGIKLTENGVVKEIVLFRPEDVRSVNAAFDVENMSESDILYSMEDDPDMDVFEDDPAEMQASEHYDFQPSRDIDVMPQREANEVVSRDATGRRILAKNLTVDDGDLVGVRLNLNVFKSTGIAVQAVHKGTTKGGHKQNKGFWNGEVLTYAPAVSLKNAYFNVQQKARDGIATGDNKMPMASVDGEYATNPNPSFGGIEVRFNPKDVRFFTDMDGRPIRYAEEVTIHGTRAYASGQIEYYKRDTAPERYSDAPSDVQFSMFSRDPNDDPEFTEEEAKAINETQAYYKSPGASSIERFRSAKDRAGTKILQKIFDPAASVRTILKDENLYRITDLAQSVSGPMQAIAQYGRPFWKDDVIQVDTKQKSFQQILAPLGSDAEVKKFLSWIIAERASNLKKENREILLTDEHIRIFKNFHRQNRALYDSVWKEFQGMQNAIYDIAVKAGNLSQEQAEVYKNSFYLPFYRELEEVSEGQQGSRFGGRSGKLVEQELFRKLKGSEKRIEDPLENILLNWHHVLGAAKRNDAGKRILQAAEDLGLSQKIDQRDAKKDPNATYVWEDGKRQWYTVDDSTDGRLLMETLGALNYDMGPWEKFAAGLAPFKHYLTWGVTVDPEFKVANFIRDTITAIGVADMSANPIKNITDGWKATRDMTDVKAQMLASGAIFSDSGFIHGGDPDAIRYLIGSEGVDRRSILDTPEKMLEFVKAGEFLSLPRSLYRNYQDAGVRLENVNRAANFVQAMEDEGKTILDAAYESRDHLAFDRMGTWRFARFMARTVPFLNARAQGLYKFGRAATDENQRKRFGATATAYAMASAALYLSMADDEDYKAAEDWERDTYHLFKAQPVAEAMGLDKETLFRIPRAFEFGAIGTLAERALEQATNDEVNGALFLQRVGHMLTHTFSIQAPAAFTPALELTANRSFFTDRPIESIYQRSNLPPEERGSAANTALAQYMSSAMAAVVPESLSESLVLSPPQIDHLARGYLAFVGDSAMKATDWAIKKAGDNPPPAANISEWLPPVARFVRNPDAPSSTKYSSLFYDRRDKINKIKGTVDKALREDNVEKAEKIWEENAELLELHRYYNRAARYMSEINGEIRMIGADKELSSGEKREQIDELKREKAALMYEIHEETRGVFDDGYNPRVFRP